VPELLSLVVNNFFAENFSYSTTSNNVVCKMRFEKLPAIVREQQVAFSTKIL